MADIKKGPASSEQQPGKQSQSDKEWKRVEEDADGMAEKAEETEKRYDDDHDIFTK